MSPLQSSKVMHGPLENEIAYSSNFLFSSTHPLELCMVGRKQWQSHLRLIEANWIQFSIKVIKKTLTSIDSTGHFNQLQLSTKLTSIVYNQFDNQIFQFTSPGNFKKLWVLNHFLGNPLTNLLTIWLLRLLFDYFIMLSQDLALTLFKSDGLESQATPTHLFLIMLWSDTIKNFLLKKVSLFISQKSIVFWCVKENSQKSLCVK